VLRPAVSHFRLELAAVSAQHLGSTRERGRAAVQLPAQISQHAPATEAMGLRWAALRFWLEHLL